ncbi:MAG: glycosyltransferase involved in cell wall biosynthesis [Cognaticolwellia sp.]
MKLLHIDTSTAWRGGQQQLALLVAGLAELGIEQRIACVPGSPLSAALSQWEQVALRAGKHPANLLKLAGQDGVICAHTSGAASMSASLGQRPIVHRRVDFFIRPAALKTRRAMGFVAVSNAVSLVLQAGGVAPKRIRVVYDGVDRPPLVEPADVGTGTIALAVGALVDHKDHRTLAAAAKLLPQCRFLVAGEGELRGELEGLGGLELLGQRPDVPALLARAQVFVHCSKEEGLGQSVLEAMRAGVPVVATRAGGVPESVGERGVLVHIQDPAALAGGIARVLAGEGPDPALAQAYADQHFSVAAMVSGTLRAYEGFVSGLA